MPVIKSAKKKLRQDKLREKRNNQIRDILSKLVKKARKSPTEKTLVAAVKIIDTAAKNAIIHKNKAARMKSSLSKLSPKQSPKKTATPKKRSVASKKTSAKKATK